MTDLSALYNSLNDKHFNGKLGPCSLVIAPLKDLEGAAYKSRGKDFPDVIVVGAHVADAEVREVLLHEMVHLHIWKADRGHGGPFKDVCMGVGLDVAKHANWRG